MRDIDAIDDLEMPRQQTFEQLDRPGLERFGQQRVVGVGQRVDGDLPRLFQRKLCRSTRMRISSVTARLGWVSLSCTAAFDARLRNCPSRRDDV